MTSPFAGLALNVDEPSRLALVHPVTGAPLRNAETGEVAWIDLMAIASTRGTAHDRAVADRITKMRGRSYTHEMALADLAEKLSVLTMGWRLIALNGAPLDVEFSAENARVVYAMPQAAWMREQIIPFIADLANFPAASCGAP